MGLNQLWDLILALLVFSALFGCSLRVKGLRESMRRRSKKEWLIDLAGLFVQGWLVPLAKFFGLYAFLRYALGSWQGTWILPEWLSFMLAFVAVDYLYYWNHRLLHSAFFWPLHRLHHSTQNLDLFSSARNSLLTPLFIVYIWIHSFMAFMLQNPWPYILGATLTSCLDLWRHSPGLVWNPSWKPLLGKLFITPSDHSWHHTLAGIHKNYGANFSLWDRLHGSYQTSKSKSAKYGWIEHSSIWRQLLIPWLKRGETRHD